jgi:hypothetical protein
LAAYSAADLFLVVREELRMADQKPTTPQTTLLDVMRQRTSAEPASTAAPETTEESCREAAGRAYGAALPTTKAFELYLVRGLGTSFKPNGTEQIGVVFPPEFLFVLEVGFPSLVGVSIPWLPVLFGDPEFPNFRRASVRSVRSRNPSELIYPDVTGSIIMGLQAGVTPDAALQALDAQGLKQIDIADSFATAQCTAFHERQVCATVEEKLPAVVRYAQPNGVVRLGDFAPGWTVVRIS